MSGLVGTLKNTTASQADHAGQPPSSFLFLPIKDEPARRLHESEKQGFSGNVLCVNGHAGACDAFGLVAQLVRARA